MTIQTVNLGTAPTGAGGDTFRSTGAKINENFTNPTHAASRLIGAAAGNVMEVGAFGLGSANDLRNLDVSAPNKLTANGLRFGMMAGAQVGSSFNFVHALLLSSYIDNSATNAEPAILIVSGGNIMLRSPGIGGASWYRTITFLSDENTTTDSNGFVKRASPVLKLFQNKIEVNKQAEIQNPIFEKIDIGHYLIKGTEGFAQEGWWIEVPTDSNGNRICAVEYQTLENGDLEIKTFKKKLNDEGDIVANLDAPIDIPSNAKGEPRWIDIRLHSVPKPTIHKVPRTEKKARMVQQLKYAPQLVYFMALLDMVDDDGKVVVVDGETQQVKKPQIQTDANGTPILKDQQVVNEKGEPVFEWVQAVDAEGNLIFDDVPVLDADGNQIYDEVTYEPQQ